MGWASRGSLTQAQLRQYESSRARLGLIDSISRYGWPDDFVGGRLRELEGMSVDSLREVARAHLSPERALVLVVGDKASVLPGLLELGLGSVQELDIDGGPLADAR